MYESFSQEVKSELCTVRTKQRCCRLSTLYGMLFGATELAPDSIRLETENPSVALYFSKLIKEFAEIRGKNEIVMTTVADPEILGRLRAVLGDAFEDPNILPSFMTCQFCSWSFIKGVFLACGTITAPGNAYHMEFLTRNEETATSLARYLAELGIPPKVIERRGGLGGVYYKDSESVVDILGYIGANRAAFKLLDVKIYKDLRNNANRVANCEAANIGKTVAASNEQMRAIESIIASGRAEELPDELRQTLDLRAAFPDASLLELASRHTPPITKSGVNHRLKRLIEFSKKC